MITFFIDSAILKINKTHERSKKYLDYIYLLLGFVVIISAIYNLNSSTMYMLCGATIICLILFLYIRNYKDHHYGGKFTKHFPSAKKKASKPFFMIHFLH